MKSIGMEPIEEPEEFELNVEDQDVEVQDVANENVEEDDDNGNENDNDNGSDDVANDETNDEMTTAAFVGHMRDIEQKLLELTDLLKFLCISLSATINIFEQQL